MAYNKTAGYWVDKEKRAEEAKAHTKEMKKKYDMEIKQSIKNTVTYTKELDISNRVPFDKDTKVSVVSCDSVSAILKHSEGKTAVLNFASYKNPGGMFLNGSKAQEECLCHESYLYNVLVDFTDTFYKWNNAHKNKALYTNRCLYSPHIRFERGKDIRYCDVITCAAPNKSAAQKYQNVSERENYSALFSRIQFILDIAKNQNVDTLIVGAFGCGVFGQDPKEVAMAFKANLELHKTSFHNVIFAIPEGKDGNLKEFRSVYNV